MLLVSLEILDRSACYTTVHSSLSNSCTNFRNQSWVNWFWDKVFRTECKVIYMINLINNVWYCLLCQISNSMDSSHLHFLIDCLGMNIQCATENVWETNHIINLVRIV